MANKNIVVAVDGKKSDTKEFVSRAIELGYSIVKINPLRLNREIASLYFPTGHPDTEFAFRHIQEFTAKENAHRWYIQKRMQELKDNEIGILVNVSTTTLNELKDDFGVFSVNIAENENLDGSRYDLTIHMDSDFGSRVEKILSVLNK